MNFNYNKLTYFLNNKKIDFQIEVSDNCGNMELSSGMIHNSGSTATSICNSVASSRESLESSSQPSRRKISITSHSKNGGKIPWCACWGNGCI